MTTTSLSRTPLSTETRRARTGVALFFLTNGALFANLLPRYPEVKAILGLTNTEFGLAVAAFPIGALIAGLAAGALVRRFRSSRVALVGTILTGCGVLLAGLSPSWMLFAGALFLAGAMDSITDVAQNLHGLRVQRLFGRSILNSFHAIWSVGAVTGGLMAGAAAALTLPLSIHLTISAVLFTLCAIVAYRLCLPGPESAEAVTEDADHTPVSAQEAPTRWGKYLILGALVLVAICGTIFEDAGNSWSALYLSDFLGSTAAVAAFGYVALTGAQFIGRIFGDRLVDRFGQRAVAVSGGTLAALGMGAALTFPSIQSTIIGFAVVGLGSATLVPAAMHAADEVPGFRPGTGVTIISWLMRVGFLISPLVVGMISDASSLRFGLLIVPLAGILVVLFSRSLSSQRT